MILRRAAAVAWAFAALSATAQPAPGVETKSAHYDVYAETFDASEAGAVLDAVWARLSAYFGSAPERRLRVEIYATQAAMHAGLERDNQWKVNAGGYYAPGTKKAYLYVQPSDYFTRQLLIHEATHQFHFLAATGNRAPAAEWYTEGLAEYFGMHNWDGKTLQTGVVPAVSLEDYPAQASKQLALLDDDAASVALGVTRCDRPLAWALVHYLVNVRPAWWHALSGRLDDGELPSTAWANACGGCGPDLGRDLRAWIDAHQQPFRIAWIAWQERGEELEGKAGVVSAAFFKEAPASFECEIELVSGDLKAGIAFNFRGNEDYCLFQVLGATARVVHREKGTWKRLALSEVPQQEKPSVSLRREGGELVLSANGREVFRAASDGDVGLNVEGCCARFRVKP
ncbi:MAG: hypothetical protein FD180_1115 [Planctomycetota bacterium]|nr:MAG: hypothetical protein FD180_1115 [Planctomycetota bacterium]